MNEQNERICRFLSQYVEINGGGLLPAEEEYLKDAIAVIIDGGVMTKDELRKEALYEYNVIIPDRFFDRTEEG